MNRNSFIHLLLVMSLVSLSACGGGDSAETADAPASDTPAADSTPMGSSSVSGTISFEGTAPTMPRVRLNRECNELNEDGIMAETIVVNDNGTLKNVFIHVTAGLADGYSFAVPSEPVVFDQRGCKYTPHVFGVQTGQEIKILNSDPLMHNINAQAKLNRPFNRGMPNQGDELLRSFRVTEVMMSIKCDVHGWMGAYVGVVDHPFFSVSDGEGGFSINDLPAGTYTIEAWHEEYGSAAAQTVTVAEGEAAELSFSFGDAS